MQRRICSLLLAGLVALTSPWTMAFANDAGLQEEGITVDSSGLCEHHTQHNESCGYTVGMPEQPCTHEHTEDCYITAENCIHRHDESCGGLDDPSACNHQCSEESGCIVKTLDCRYQHDENCGYAPAAAGTPCTFVCGICSAQDNSEQEEDPQLSGNECICETLCEEGSVNSDCPVCSVEGADLSACKGGLTGPAEDEIICSDDINGELQGLVEAGLQDNPQLLTMEDVFAANPQLETMAAAVPSVFSLNVAQTNPGTYITTDDNEDNAGTGQPDGDLDSYLKRDYASHPIEVTIDILEGKLPTQSCYIAVRTYDVDWAGTSGFHNHYEYDKLFVNDVRVGTLTGLNGDWNISYYQVPLSALREGKNTIRVEIWDCEGAENFSKQDGDHLNPTPYTFVAEGTTRRYMADWGISIDWMQLICDGGSREGVEEYFLSLTDVSTTANDIQVSVQTSVRAAQGPYNTEYTITDANGFILGAYHGMDVSGAEEFVITMPKGQPYGEYTITGFLKRQDDGAIMATDQADFSIENGVSVLSPRLGHTLSPASWTNGDVKIQVELIDGLGYQNIEIEEAEKTVAQNGTYEFTYSYETSAGTKKTDVYTVSVGNIDKTPPELSCDGVTVMEERIMTGWPLKSWLGLPLPINKAACRGTPPSLLPMIFVPMEGQKQ